MASLLYLVFIYPIIFILPAYFANAAPVIFGGGMPLDLNRKFRRKPIFGRHKTIKGLVAGISAGILVGFAESLVPGFSFMLAVGVLESLGANFGDLLGSFIKRRIGAEEGTSIKLLDRYLFLVFAITFAFPLGYSPSIPGIVFLFILTWLMHGITNAFAYKIKLKSVPW